MTVSIGCDPEIFLFSDKQRQYVSAHGIVPGTKQQPHFVGKGAVQVDGTALEFNILPADNLFEFTGNINHVTEILKRMVNSHNDKHNTDYEMSNSSTAYYTADYWKKIPDHAKELGCDPDFDAYSEEQNIAPAHKRPMRHAGGHIHVGFREPGVIDNDHIFDCIQLVKQLDAVLYPLSYLWDKDMIRRKAYGKKGNFRPKPYGVEYRTLSNAWLKSRETKAWVFMASKLAQEYLASDIIISSDPVVIEALTKESSNLNDIETYYTYLKDHYELPNTLDSLFKVL